MTTWQRKSVIPHTAVELIAVFEDEEGTLKNATVRDPALGAKYSQHRADKHKVDGTAMATIATAEQEFATAAQALEAKYQADAAALAATRDAAIDAATKLQEKEAKALAQEKAKLDVQVFKLAEKAGAA